VLELLEYPPDAVVVDATVGYAGHALALAARLNRSGQLIGLDVDNDILAVDREKLHNAACRVELIRGNFGQLDVELEERGISSVDVILADLGTNAAQLSAPERGFSFGLDGPLDMRLDDRLSRTAADLVNSLPEKELADLIWSYSQERHSRRIARKIAEVRRERPIKSTFELVEIIRFAVRIRSGKGRLRIHPATRTFQALRIAVNDELEQLRRLLELAPGLLKANGQIAVISFHSLEDRIVKWNFRANRSEGNYEIMTAKPVVADRAERDLNPRSRSAKLRVARRIGKVFLPQRSQRAQS